MTREPSHSSLAAAGATEVEPFDLSSEELERYPTGVITLARDGTILRYNRAESALSGLAPHDVIGRRFFAEVAPCTAVAGFQGRFEIFAEGTTSAVERFDWVFTFGWGHQDVSITLMRRRNRREIHLIVTVRSQKNVLGAASAHGSGTAPLRRRAVAEASLETDVGIWADDPSTNMRYRSAGLHRMLAAGTELAEHGDPIVRYLHPAYAAAFSSELERAREHGRAYHIRTSIVTGDGRHKDVLVHGAFLPSSVRDCQRSIGTVVDLTHRRTVEDRLWASAHLDALTQLPNRRLLSERLHAALAAGSPVAVCFIDLDKFKRVNDTAGHAAGDQLLRVVAERIVNAIRPHDVVARINGDEFVIILADETRPAAVDALVARVLEAVAEPYAIAGKTHLVSASAGIATSPDDGTTADELLCAADTAMYRAKASGAGGYRHYDGAMRDRDARDDARTREIDEAIARGEIVPYFQAIVDATSRAIVGAEALARWNHPEQGTLDPAAFVSLAEGNGSIHLLGETILRASCREAKRWFDARGEASPFVSVNVSPLQFRDRRFAKTIGRVLAETGLPAHKLELEFTESLVMDRFDETIVALANLKTLGVRLSIDDFGTGYSALAYLKYFPVDTVKLDRGFVEGVDTDPLDESIVETVVMLAQRLHLDVIAEGVERETQARKLGALGCDTMQGFLFFQPCTAAEFATRLGADATR